MHQWLSLLICAGIAGCWTSDQDVHQVFDLEAARAGAFYAVPFPENERLRMDTSAGIKNFPNPAQLNILREYKQVFADHFRGFGTNSAIYIAFDGELDGNAFLDAVHLIDITPESPDYGKRAPIEVRYSRDASQYTEPNMLAILPVPGHPLRPDTTYAAIVEPGVRTASGGHLKQSPHIEKRLQAPDAIGLNNLDMDEDQIAALAIFTTVDPTADFIKVGSFLRNRPDLVSLDPLTTPVTWTYPDGTRCHEYTGRVKLPNFQHGQIPYVTQGGAFQFDSTGTPLVSQTDAVRVTIRLPENASASNSMPYVVYSHGTGGSYRSVRSVSQQLCARGIAVIGADQPLHGDRIDEGDPSFLTFNLINPVAMVHNFQQGGLESIALAMIMENLTIPSAISPYGFEVRMDPEHQMFMGHSQGALTGLYTLAVDGKRHKAAVLSGSSGGLILALIHKVEPINFPLLLELGLSSVGELDLFHPALSLFQMFGEAADPLNYARYLVREAHPDIEDWRPLHLFQSEGIVDKFTPPEQAEALAAALGVRWVAPELQAVEPLEILGQTAPDPRPFSGNISIDGNDYTAALIQYPLGHFSLTDDPDGWEEFAEFLEDAANDLVPTIQPR